MKVNVKKLSEFAKLPAYGSEYAAGADLYAAEPVCIAPGETAFVHTGIAVELPAGTVGLVYARSGLACKQDLAPANKVGVIDADYRGELMVPLYNHSGKPFTVCPGDRIAQLVVTPVLLPEAEEYPMDRPLPTSERGTGGFGSTGVHEGADNQ